MRVYIFFYMCIKKCPTAKLSYQSLIKLDMTPFITVGH